MGSRYYELTHNGVVYYGVRDDERTITGSITNGKRKWTLKGYPKIQKTKGSYKYGKEVQITIYNRYGTTFEKARVQFEPNGDPKKHKWETVELFFPPDVWQDLIALYLETMKEVNDDKPTA